MASFRVRVRGRFEAAHHLTSYRGRPEPNHGHSWRVEAVLESPRLDAEGMAYDFVLVKATLDELCSAFDHGDVNSVPPFDHRSPTTEHLAQWFFDRLLDRLPDAPFREVTVWEGPDCSATYLAGEDG